MFNGLTNIGKEYIAKCLAENKPITFTKVKIGDGLLDLNENAELLTDIKSLKKEVEILDKTQEGEMTTLTILLDNSDLEVGYYPREIGIYVQDNGVEKLYWYINDGVETQWLCAANKYPIKFKQTINLMTTNLETVIINWTGKGLFVDKEFVEEKIKEKVRTFEIPTIAELQRKNLKVGDIVEVLGYYSAGDGAGHKRIIANEDDGSGVQLSNSLWANIVHNGEINVSWLGAKGDGVTDDCSYFQKAVNHCGNINTVLKLDKDLLVNLVIKVSKKVKINGNEKTITTTRYANKLSDEMLFNLSAEMEIYNLKVVNNVQSTQSGIVFCECYYNKIKMYDCSLKGFRTGLGQIGNFSIIKNCYIELSVVKNETQDAFYGIHGECSDCFIDNNTIKNGRHSIYLSGDCKRNVVFNNKCYDSEWQNIHIYSTSNAKICENTIISNNYTENAKSNGITIVGFSKNTKILNNIINNKDINIIGIKIEGSDNNFVQNLEIYNNTISSGKGIWIKTINKVNINNNNLTINDNAIIAETNSKDVSIINNNIKCLNTAENIITVSSCDKAYVYNNVILDLPSKLWSINNEYVACGFRVENSNDIFLNNNYVDGYIVKATKYSNNVYSITKSNFLQNESYNIPNIAHITGDIYKYIKSNSCYLTKCISSGTPGTWEKYSLQKNSQIAQLNTPYMATKMQQEGVYNDFITYMDEKTLYNKQQRKLEEQRQLAYEQALQKNPELTFEEFMSVQPTNLNLIEEPQPSKLLKQFMEKYL